MVGNQGMQVYPDSIIVRQKDYSVDSDTNFLNSDALRLNPLGLYGNNHAMVEQDESDMEREYKQAMQRVCIEKLNEFVSDFLPRLPTEHGTPDGIWTKRPFELPPESQVFAYPRGRVPSDMDVTSVHPTELYRWMDLIVVLPDSALEGLPLLPQWQNRPKPATRLESGQDNAHFKPRARQSIPVEHRTVGILEVRADSFVELYESVTRISGNGLDPVRLKLHPYEETDPFGSWLNDPKWDFDLRKLTQDQTELLYLCFVLARDPAKINPSLFPVLFNLRAGKRYVLKVDGVQYMAPAPIQFLTYPPNPEKRIRPVFRHYPGTEKIGAIERRPHLLLLQSFNRLLRIYLREESAKLSQEALPADSRLQGMIKRTWELHRKILNPESNAGS